MENFCLGLSKRVNCRLDLAVQLTDCLGVVGMNRLAARRVQRLYSHDFGLVALQLIINEAPKEALRYAKLFILRRGRRVCASLRACGEMQSCSGLIHQQRFGFSLIKFG